MARELSTEVIDFIYHYVESVDVLDVLTRLAAEPSRTWTGGDMADALGCPLENASDLLAAVHFLGFTALTEGKYRFSVNDDSKRRGIEAFITAYRRRPAAVIREIGSLGGPRSFANAFKLRKKGDSRG